MATGFETVHFDLSMCDPEYGTPLQANAYHVDGIRNVDGSLRDLSIGQLVMAICLQRASALETDIVSMMSEMSTTAANLEALTTCQQYFADNESKSFSITPPITLTWNGKTMENVDSATKLINFLTSQDYVGITIADSASLDDVIQAISSKMDSLNSVNQEELVQLQSLVSKRDQSYDLITNVLKSLNTVLVGTANNL